MQLYHFCGKDFIKGIQREGLTKGTFATPKKNGWAFRRMRQWLTEEPAADKQSWATRKLLDYCRTDYRLTVTIPDRYAGNLIRAADYVRNMPPAQRGIVTDWAGHEAWWIYIGAIPPEWISNDV